MKNQAGKYAIPPIVGVSENIRRTRELIEHIADTGLNTVICGESGVGKEVIAQNLYLQSPRKDKPFLKINCAALPEGLLESELFGHEQGAFTGADRKKKGKFELAHGGTLLLDEIGDMSISLQAKLLHVLQSGEFAPLGSEKDMKTDVWIMAATNHDLEKSIREEKFREDLYYRLNIIKIYLAPLRNRREDIPALIDFYCTRYSVEFKCEAFKEIDNGLIKRLTDYHWPGNVRQLQNVLKRILVLGNGEEVLDELASGETRFSGANEEFTAGVGNPGLVLNDFLSVDENGKADLASLSLKKVRKKAVDRIEKEVISYVLNRNNWNRSKSAKVLKVSYKTLLTKIKDLKIDPPEDTGY